jgi:hypothetical protein
MSKLWGSSLLSSTSLHESRGDDVVGVLEAENVVNTCRVSGGQTLEEVDYSS